MKFKAVTITGKGRGKDLGFPTINMQVLPELVLGMQEGIYAARVTIDEETYGGALFYGPVPVFGETEKSLEVYLVDSGSIYVGPGREIEVELVKYIRPVQDFSSVELMQRQMIDDVTKISHILEK
jgi:riboflavin kinase/FMN adenylyltransferase